MKKLFVLGGAFLFLVLMSGCEVTPAGGAYAVYGEYPTTYYGDYYSAPVYSAPVYPYYGYHRWHHWGPYDRDHYWDRGHYWGHYRGHDRDDWHHDRD